MSTERSARDRARSRAGRRVVLGTIIVISVFAAATLATAELLRRRYAMPWALDLGLGLGLVLVVAVGGLVIAVLAAKGMAEIRRARSSRVLPVIQQHAAAHIAGTESGRQLARLARLFPREFDEAVVPMLEALSGTPAARLSSVVREAGVQRRWQRRAAYRSREERVEAINKLGLLDDPDARTVIQGALTDPSARVRMIAARMLLRTGLTNAIEKVFLFTIRQSLLIRAVVEDELGRHARLLLRDAVPRALRSADRREVVNTLEMLLAWRIAIPIELVERFFRDPDPSTRALALRLLPFVSPPADHAELLNRELSSDEAEVRCAAARSAGRLRAAETIDKLDACLDSEVPAVALAAAAALARLGRAGLDRLEERVVSDRGGAGAALEAIEKQRLGRLQEGLF